MITVIERKEETAEKLLSLEEEERLIKLIDKQEEKLFEVAFCGHFSAGKSTILNRLLGVDVLPTSPIPTSANIIRIKNGEFGLTLSTKEKQTKIWNGEIPWNQVRLWGMNGQDIAEMTITAPLSFLGEHSCILDTPGVDSTDESHEAITVEQLYTTDLIVYVMDYNHVQSETNLYFLKQLSLEKKPIYIVINQVDKHNENEIPFSKYEQSTKDVFDRFEIQYLKLYFTTTKYPDHPFNQFKTFEKEIKSLLFNSNNLLEGSLQRLKQGVYKAAQNRLQQQKQEELDSVLSEMEEKGYRIDQMDERQQSQAQLQLIRRFDQELIEQFERDLGSLFKNVTLFPFTTTDLARNWIESIQPNFKVGLLFSNKKTIEEQENRLEILVKELQEKVKTQLLFHVTAYFQKVDRSKLTNEIEFEEALNRIDFNVSAEWLKEHVRMDHSSRDYVYVFTSLLTSLIVSDIRKKARAVLELQIVGLKEYVREEERALTEKLVKLNNIEEYTNKIENIKSTYADLFEEINQILTTFPPASRFDQQLIEASYKSYPDQNQLQFTDIALPVESVIETSWNYEVSRQSIDFSEKDINNWLIKIKEVLANNKSNSILSHEREHLIERIERYEQQTFTVSLFGAFSAGKSSFANALLGDYILPVSPNPTTATINTIEKSTKEFDHGTAKVTLKTHAALNEEIKTVSEQLDLALDLDKIVKWKPNMKEYGTSWQKTLANYLLTIKESINTTKWQFGSIFIVELSEAQQFIADEHKACLVEKVNIYYDSPITKQGIIIVDTPGVNSIHGRHTNVAFQQMRTSDAIFYLTYYNHAFSKADQYFLQQMGKVNEIFQYDKLYFIINASDLANNEGELNGVKKHVYDQLVRNGIENPRLFHLSSKKGLKAKKEGMELDTTFAYFENNFYEQTILELKQLSAKILIQQIHHFIEKMNDSIAFMYAEEGEQKVRQKTLQSIVTDQIDRIKQVSFQYVLRDILLELDQLILYLRDRMRFVLNDYFSTAINVAGLTGNSKKELHQQLMTAIKEWKGLGEHFLKQELEATMIRVEEKIKVRARQWLTDELKKVQSVLPYTYIENLVEIDSLKSDIQDLHITIDSNQYLPYLKSKKDFFENGMVKQLKERLIADGVGSSEGLILEYGNKLSRLLEKKVSSLETDLKDRLIDSIQNELDRFKALFDDKEKTSLVSEYEDLLKIAK